ncbi:MAG: hypothetical protein ABIG39_06385 [Candidatus Micrarchaeota archaeon]
MGFSTAIAMILIMLGIAGALVIAYPIIESSVHDISDAFRIQNENYKEQHQTSLNVENITVEGDCSLYNITIALNNTGSVGLRLDKMDFLDNNEVLENVTGTTINTTTFYSTPGVDGHISFNGVKYLVSSIGDTSYIGEDRSGPSNIEYRSYFSFDTSDLLDGASVTGATLYAKSSSFVKSAGLDSGWRVDYYYGNDVLGVTLDTTDWGCCTYFDGVDYEETTGWESISVPSAYISKTGDTDFELIENWAVGANERKYVLIYQTDSLGLNSDPYLNVSYAVTSYGTVTGILAPAKSINITYMNMSSADSEHRVAVVTEDGISAYGTYDCS